MLRISRSTNTEAVSIAIGRALYLGRKERRSLQKATPIDHTFNNLFTFPSPICALEFSGCGQYFATCCEDKVLTLWNCQEIPVWKEKAKCVIPKRPIALAFTCDSKHLLAANKGGDVMRYEIDSLVSCDTSPLLGHCAIVLDLKCLIHSSSRMYIATCDRDEKIRVSNYPNSYNIHTYCLGHKDFVSKISTCSLFKHLLISGSGDGTVRVWDWYNGVLLDTVTVVNTDVTPKEEEEDEEVISSFITGLSCSPDNILPVIAVTVNGSNTVYLYNLTDTGQLIHRHDIELNGIPWSIQFYTEERLWVGTQVNGQYPIIQCVSISDKNKAIVCNDPWVDLINETLSTGEKINLIQTDWSWLKKSDFDNMSTYYAKKNERLQNKRMKLEKDDNQSPSLSGSLLKEQSTV